MSQSSEPTDRLEKMATDTLIELIQANSDKYRLQTGLLEILNRVCNLAAPLDRNELISIINKSLNNDPIPTTRKEDSQKC